MSSCPSRSFRVMSGFKNFRFMSALPNHLDCLTVLMRGCNMFAKIKTIGVGSDCEHDHPL